MTTLIPPSERDTRLGSILTRTGLVSKGDVIKGLAAASSARLPLGNILILGQKLTRHSLRLSIEAQWMIKDGLLDEDTAFEAVQLAKRNNWTWSDALIALGTEAHPMRGARLGDLLIRTKILNDAQLAEELELSNLTGLPLGRVIVARRTLAEGTIWHAIRLQQAIRQESLGVEQASERLVKINDRLLCSDIKLAELFVAAGRLRKKDVDVGIGLADANLKPFTEVLHEMGWVDDELLERAYSIQALLRANRINYGEAIFFLREGSKNYALDDHALPPQRRLRFYDFLKLNEYLNKSKLREVVARLVSDDKLLYEILHAKKTGDKQADIKSVFHDDTALARILCLLFPDDMHPIYCARAAYTSIEQGELTPEEALIKFFEVSRGHQTMPMSFGTEVLKLQSASLYTAETK